MTEQREGPPVVETATVEGPAVSTRPRAHQRKLFHDNAVRFYALEA